MLNPHPGNERLIAKIRGEMARRPNGRLSFREFMEFCLYDPEDGYYMGEQPKVGKDGDFYTSSAVGSIMGEAVARHFAAWAQAVRGKPTFIEWGGGTGRLARQMLDALQADFPDVYRRAEYRSIEASGYHRALQEEQLAPHGEKVRIIDEREWLDKGPFDHVYCFSNELLDAFPVHRVRMEPDGLKEIYVYWDDAANAFAETAGDVHADVADYVRRHGIRLVPGQSAEINPAAERWIFTTAKRLRSGVIVTIDYGDVAEELYAAHRMNGTLLCYKRHIAHENPYIFVGEQDMTAHVDFSACIAAGLAAGTVRSWKLLTQRDFLLENGVLDMLRTPATTDPFSPEMRRNRAVRQLLLGDGMSERFKVLIQHVDPSSASQ